MQNAQALRIYIGEQDKYKGRPLFRALAERACQEKLAGCTVTHGILGFGAGSPIHTAAILSLSEHLPMVVEIVDSREKLESFLPIVESMVTEGLVTIEDIRVLIYRRSSD